MTEIDKKQLLEELTEIEIEMIEEAVETEIEMIEVMTETKEEEMMIELPVETEGITTILEGMTETTTEVFKTLQLHCMKGLEKSSTAITDNLSKRLSPSINNGLSNLQESIPEVKGAVDAIKEIPVIAKFLRINTNKNQEENKDESIN